MRGFWSAVRRAASSHFSFAEFVLPGLGRGRPAPGGAVARPPARYFATTEGIKLLPATPGQAFLLAYVCGILWYAGNCYWIFNTMRQYGGLNSFAAAAALLLFCMYLALYHGLFGLLISLLAGKKSFNRLVLLLAPALWVAVELARTRITGFPWDLLGTAQVDNIPLAHSRLPPASMGFRSKSWW